MLMRCALSDRKTTRQIVHDHSKRMRIGVPVSVTMECRMWRMWRLCFEWPKTARGPGNVEIVDYH